MRVETVRDHSPSKPRLQFELAVAGTVQAQAGHAVRPSLQYPRAMRRNGYLLYAC
jgi:hypothetical protein